MYIYAYIYVWIVTLYIVFPLLFVLYISLCNLLSFVCIIEIVIDLFLKTNIYLNNHTSPVCGHILERYKTLEKELDAAKKELSKAQGYLLSFDNI